jgi:polyhydroxyalkanoate synthesis regulator protein
MLLAAGVSSAMVEANPWSDAILIKRYGGCRLYRPATSTYVSLVDLAEMILAGRRIKVLEAEMSEDVTREILDKIS